MKKHHSHHIPSPEELLLDYLSFIRLHRGLSPSTCSNHQKAIAEFFEYLAGRGLSLTELKVKDLDDFILQVAERSRSKGYMHQRTSSLRGFLRYLFSEGWLELDLSRFVESPRIYREATLPPHFTWAELERLVASVKGDEPSALRDRAMLILLCTYGLRAKEAAALTLDDLDWTHKLLRISNRKGG